MKLGILIAAAVLHALMLGGCMTTTVETETPQQEFYAVKSDYQTALRIAVAYKRDCDIKPVELKNGCEGYVAVMQRIDLDVIFPALAKAESAMDMGDDVRISATVALLRAAIRQLTGYIAAKNIGAIEGRSGPLPDYLPDSQFPSAPS